MQGRECYVRLFTNGETIDRDGYPLPYAIREYGRECFSEPRAIETQIAALLNVEPATVLVFPCVNTGADYHAFIEGNDEQSRLDDAATEPTVREATPA